MKARIIEALQLENVAKLLLRLVVAGLMLFHGLAKVTYGLEYIRSTLAAAGLPIWLSPGVFIGEIIAPIFLILGYGTRIAASVLVVNMLFTIYLSPHAAIFSLNEYGGWTIELNVFYLITAICILLLGGGRFSIKKSGLLS